MRTLSAPNGGFASGGGGGGAAGGSGVPALPPHSQRKSLACPPLNGQADTITPTPATHKLTNFQSALKIEEMAAAKGTAMATGESQLATTIEDLKSRRQRQLSGGDMETMLASQPMSMPKRVGINHAVLTSRNAITPPPASASSASQSAASVHSAKGSSSAGTTPGYLVDVTKKGSTSTIWTSEESILRSVGAVDEDNK
ncbi:GD20422 [Drosophila simulans]|uniref:GD20422 n=1 Tax=Drosophila simulans TaxID=7240 RepID=B4QZV3_DROSI|nr:GD20422 [Drosophila simulans]